MHVSDKWCSSTYPNIRLSSCRGWYTLFFINSSITCAVVDASICENSNPLAARYLCNLFSGVVHGFCELGFPVHCNILILITLSTVVPCISLKVLVVKHFCY